MPASNRRPIWGEEDVVSQSSSLASVSASPAVSPDATATVSIPPPAPQAADVQATFKQPCTFKGAASAVYAGMLGYFLGVVPAAIRFKGRQWGMTHSAGLASAKQLALMSGMYTAVHCICQRIRMVEDGWNRGIAGCSTGLVLGWSNGPWGALQSCAGLGLISALIDLGSGAVEAAEARVLHSLQDIQQQQATMAAAAHSKHDWPQQLPPMLPGLALLLLGMPPDTRDSALLGTAGSSSSGGVGDDGGAHVSAPSSRHHSGSGSSGQTSRPKKSAVKHPREQQEQAVVFDEAGFDVLQHSQRHHQQQAAAAAAMAPLLQQLRPAVRAVSHLLATPPLMFLGHCCHSNSNGSSSSSSRDMNSSNGQAGRRSRSRRGSFAAAAGAAAASADGGIEVDACPVAAQHIASLLGGRPSQR